MPRTDEFVSLGLLFTPIILWFVYVSQGWELDLIQFLILQTLTIINSNIVFKKKK